MFDFEKVNEELYKKVFWIISVLMLIIMVYQSRNYGMNWDEYWFKDYGEDVLNFYLSLGQDRTLETKARSATYETVAYYGGLVELIVAIINRYFSNRDPFDNHHFVTAIFGFIGVIFCGLTAKQISGWRAAIISSCFLFVTPVYFANSMHNSKDIPFAVGNIAALYFMIVFLKEWPKVNRKACIGLAIAISVAIGVRAGGILLIPYIGLFFLIKNLYSYLEGEYTSKKELFEQIKRGVLPLGLTVLGGYIGSLLFWPYALLNPITVPIKALKLLSNIYFFDSYGLFDGKWIHRWEIPWYYIPKWIILFISLAPLVLLALVILLKGKLPKQPLLFSAMLLFASIFPIVFVIIKQSNLYDGWRHMYFVYPPLVVVCALIWDGLLSINKKQVQVLLSFGLLVLTLEPFFFMIRNHPNEQFYFSPLVGGISGAFKKYEMDYYGTSFRGAIEWIAKDPEINKSTSKIRVSALYGEYQVPKHYIDKYPQLVYVNSSDPSDYSLILPSQAKHNHDLLLNWPPASTVYQIKADGVPIVAVVKNNNPPQNTNDLLAKLKSNSKDLTANFFLDLSLGFFQAKDYPNAIVAAERALQKQHSCLQ
ncbi:MAG: hypothetical protein FD167_3020 [bacterium]|nr:MAG: hypothetical protein FD167_3020 [bacterium]